MYGIIVCSVVVLNNKAFAHSISIIFPLSLNVQAYEDYVAKKGTDPLLPAVPYGRQQIFFIAFAQVRMCGLVHNT